MVLAVLDKPCDEDDHVGRKLQHEQSKAALSQSALPSHTEPLRMLPQLKTDNSPEAKVTGMHVGGEKRKMAEERGKEVEPDPDAESSDGWYPALAEGPKDYRRNLEYPDILKAKDTRVLLRMGLQVLFTLGMSPVTSSAASQEDLAALRHHRGQVHQEGGGKDHVPEAACRVQGPSSTEGSWSSPSSRPPSASWPS